MHLLLEMPQNMSLLTFSMLCIFGKFLNKTEENEPALRCLCEITRKDERIPALSHYSPFECFLAIQNGRTFHSFYEYGIVEIA